MKILKFLIYALTFTFGLSACTDKPVKFASENDFALGADISWITEMESHGDKFYNFQGEERECTALMKELGMNAIRLRVWVDPIAHENWCNKADMLVKARRAHELGMDIMVDFHYSDWWADPGQQHKPASWKGLSLDGLKKAMADHTTEVLKSLKSEGIAPRWVQVGNEIRPGMMWDSDRALSGASYDVKACDVKEWGSTSQEIAAAANWDNLAAFINVGYEAVKQVFAEAVVIVHLDNGYDNQLYNWFFDNLKQHGARWDMVGMSIYPFWTMMEHKEYTADQTITDCIRNINLISKKYDCDVMIVETGMECADDNGQLSPDSVLENGKRLLTRLIVESCDSTDNRCRGVFYWEPECKPAAYRLGAFTSEGKPTVIMDAFRNH